MSTIILTLNAFNIFYGELSAQCNHSTVEAYHNYHAFVHQLMRDVYTLNLERLKVLGTSIYFTKLFATYGGDIDAAWARYQADLLERDKDDDEDGELALIGA
jgi:hypothetical protein